MDPTDLAAVRAANEAVGLVEADLPADPIEVLRRWRDEARAVGLPEPDAVALATSGADGRPVARFVLVRGLDDRGLTFFTNRQSRKGEQLAANPYASLTFPYYGIGRQAIVAGPVEVVDDAESDEYWATRPRESQLAARASDQSRFLDSRATLEERFAAEAASHPGAAPCPSHWGGYRLVPDAVELWHGRPHRLHDRVLYERDGAAPSGWRISRLYP